MSYEYERVTTPATGLRLHLNENTAGCSPAVIEALQSLTRQDAACYPDYDAAIQATAAHLGMTPDRVLLTNGLDEGIFAVSVAALRGFAADAPAEAIVVQPAFDMYAACTDAAGGRVVFVAPEANLSFPAERVLIAITDRTRIVWLTTPNNPTGQVIPRDVIVTVAKAAPHATIFVDEAYADFSGTTLIGDPILDELPNIVIGRTFAKAHGLAALRAGALVAAPATVAPLRRVVLPYSINVATAVALPAAFADRSYFERYLNEVQQSKQLLYAALDAHGIEYWPSQANFVLARFGTNATRVAAQLAARGVIVRDRSSEAGCGGCLRMTTGIVEDTRALIAALEEVLCDAA